MGTTVPIGCSKWIAIKMYDKSNKKTESKHNTTVGIIDTHNWDCQLDRLVRTSLYFGLWRTSIKAICAWLLYCKYNFEVLKLKKKV